MRLVTEQYVDLVGLERAELVEVPEHRLHPRCPLPRHFAQRLGERRRAGRVQHRPALPRQLAEQGQCDDALARARAADHDDRLLGDAATGPLQCAQHQAVRRLLLVLQPESLAPLHLVGGQRQQLPARAHRAAEQLVGRLRTGGRGQPPLEVVEELRAPLPGEQPTLLVLGQPEQLLDVEVRRVVQVRHAGQRVVEIGQRREEVAEVPAVPPYLLTGVQPGPAVRRHHTQIDGVLEQRGRTPLLELDDDVRRLSGPRVHAAQHDVGAVAGQRQLVLDQHLHVVEPGLHEVGGQRVQAALPGPDLGRRGRTGQAVPVLLDEGGQQAAVEDLRTELRHSGTVERHGATPDEGRTDLPAGGGSSGVADSLVGPQCLTRRNLRDPTPLPLAALNSGSQSRRRSTRRRWPASPRGARGCRARCRQGAGLRVGLLPTANVARLSSPPSTAAQAPRGDRYGSNARASRWVKTLRARLWSPTNVGGRPMDARAARAYATSFGRGLTETNTGML
jgi:hypothetical protein